MSTTFYGLPLQTYIMPNLSQCSLCAHLNHGPMYIYSQMY